MKWLWPLLAFSAVVVRAQNADALAAPLTSAGKGLIRVAADSWAHLQERTRPTFAWNGRDLLWIREDARDAPEFVLDEAYVYQPPGELARWVLLDLMDGRMDDAEFCEKIMGRNLRGTPKLLSAVPQSDNDAGTVDDYAVALARDPRGGAVYEIGWQNLRSNGSGHGELLRHIYVWRDAQRRWHFVGEGPESYRGKNGYNIGYSSSVQARVVWTAAVAAVPPFEVRFVEELRDEQWTNAGDPDDFMPLPDLVTRRDYVLAGKFPAPLQRLGDHDYLLAERGDTLESIAVRFGAWRLDAPVSAKGDPRAIEPWRHALQAVNPSLARGEISVATRVELLNDTVCDKIVSEARSAGRQK